MNNSLTTKYLAKISLSIVATFLTITANACDICGCFMGLTPYDNQSSFAILYRYRSFNGYQGQNHAAFPKGSQFFIPNSDRSSPMGSHHADPTDYEIYRTLEIRARYFLHKRIELNAILPYNSNTEQYNQQKSSIAGLGDVNLYVGYHLIRKLDQPVINQRLIVGTGLKLPSGRNNVLSENGMRYGALMQPGTGSTDGFLYANYLLGYRKFGVSINTSFKFNGQNSDHEGIANSNTSFVNFFMTQALQKNWQIMPSIQLFYENSAGETYKGIKTGEHKMHNLMMGLGADLFYKNVALNIGFQKNTWEAHTDHPQSAAKIHLGLTYNFNQLYYLIKS